jgi:hypothetical protein
MYHTVAEVKYYFREFKLSIAGFLAFNSGRSFECIILDTMISQKLRSEMLKIHLNRQVDFSMYGIKTPLSIGFLRVFEISILRGEQKEIIRDVNLYHNVVTVCQAFFDGNKKKSP